MHAGLPRGSRRPPWRYLQNWARISPKGGGAGGPPGAPPGVSVHLGQPSPTLTEARDPFTYVYACIIIQSSAYIALLDIESRDGPAGDHVYLRTARTSSTRESYSYDLNLHAGPCHAGSDL